MKDESLIISPYHALNLLLSQELAAEGYEGTIVSKSALTIPSESMPQGWAHIPATRLDLALLDTLDTAPTCIVLLLDVAPEIPEEEFSHVLRLADMVTKTRGKLILGHPRPLFLDASETENRSRLNTLRKRLYETLAERSMRGEFSLLELSLPPLYGELNQRGELPALFAAALEGKPLSWPGHPDDPIELLHLRDAQRALLHGRDFASQGGTKLSIGGDREIRASDLVDLIIGYTGHRSKAIWEKVSFLSLFRKKSPKPRSWNPKPPSALEKRISPRVKLRDGLRDEFRSRASLSTSKDTDPGFHP